MMPKFVSFPTQPFSYITKLSKLNIVRKFGNSPLANISRLIHKADISDFVCTGISLSLYIIMDSPVGFNV